MAALETLIRRPVPRARWIAAGDVATVETTLGVTGFLLRSPAASLSIPCDSSAVYITFWQHAWSGVVVIAAAGREIARGDLYAPNGQMTTLKAIPPPGCSALTIHRFGERNPAAQDSEVIVVAASQA